MPATVKIPGFVSQRKFAKYMKEYYRHSCIDDSVVDPVSRELYNSRGEKGRKGEFLVSGMFDDMGYRTQVLSGYDGCDVMVKINNKWIKVEVKTSTLDQDRRYQFHRIKPNNFNLIALVFVGKDHTTVQIGGEKAKKFIVRCATWVRRDHAYSMGFNRMRKHSKIVKQTDIWFDLTKQNMTKVLNKT